jgi:integrase
MAEKLTDRIVKALVIPAKGSRIVYDQAVAGFGCRITAAGSRAFVLNYRCRADGRERRYTIGGYPDWSTGAARDEAKRLKRAIDGGADPVGELQAKRSAPTVNDLCDRFVEDHLDKLRPSTASDYRSRIDKILRPRLGKLKVAAVAFADIEDLHRHVTRERGPYSGNRTVALLLKLFNQAIRWQWRSNNPAKGIERNPEHKRQRYLSGEELARFTKALAADQDQQAVSVLRLLILTGARKNEVLTMRWDDLDLKAGIWVKPHTRTKQKTEHRVPLSAPARIMLRDIERTSEFVFPGHFGAAHRINIEDAWRRVRKGAKLTGFRLHDLRHSYASHLASAGIGLHIIGALLGHSEPKTTHRYAHLMDDPLRVAAERAGAAITGKPVAGRRVGKVLPFGGGRA